MPSSALYTLGYEKRTLEQYVALLHDAGVNVVIDVRETPWSHKPGFSKGPMAAGLGPAGIEYLHAKFAGNPKALRRDAASNAEAIERYRDYLATHPGIAEELNRIVDDFIDEGKTVALTCFERLPADCHRAVLAEAWRANEDGRRVVHLGE